MYSTIPKYNKFDTLVHFVGFTIEIYYDARPYERQIPLHRILKQYILHFYTNNKHVNQIDRRLKNERPT